jgi:CheY-like chemotaxis protein
LQEILTGWHMQPTVVDGGEAALAALRARAIAQTPFRLVLLDVQMPGLDGFTVAERIKAMPELAGATIMMLSSNNQQGDGARCRELGVDLYLVKPITQADLLDAVRRVLRMTQQSKKKAPAVQTRLTAHSQRPLHILLAEDNLVNQRVATRLLEKQGHTTELAETGKQALQLWEKGAFDLVLMDLQMPELSGLEAAALIRERERATGKRIPIVALTAHAMKTDEQRCLAVGMDGYLSKPIKPSDLFELIESLTSVTPQSLGHTPGQH